MTTVSFETLKETIREDGLRVISKHLPHTKKVTMSIINNTGGANDPVEHAGLAHFLEHMAFNGTSNMSRDEIASCKGRYFLNSNAFTSFCNTCYWAEVVYTHFDRMCNWLFDIYLNSVFTEDLIEKEKSIISAEIDTSLENMNRQNFFQLTNLFLVGDHPMKRPVLGTRESIQTIDRDLLLQTRDSWHVSKNTTIICVGNVDHDEMMDKVNDFFPSNPLEAPELIYEGGSRDFQTNRAIIERSGRKDSIVSYACKVPVTHDDHQLQILAHLNGCLGGNPDSILYEEIRRERGLAYSVSSYLHKRYPALGFWLVITAKVSPENLKEVEKALLQVACESKISRDLFERKQAISLDRALVFLEDINDWEAYLFSELITSEKDISYLADPVDRIRKDIKEVTYEEVDELKEQLLSPERLACAIVKPTD